MVRSYRFDFPARKLEVQKAVQAGADSTGDEGSFGAASPIDIRQLSSSFDEPDILDVNPIG